MKIYQNLKSTRLQDPVGPMNYGNGSDPSRSAKATLALRLDRCRNYPRMMLR